MPSLSKSSGAETMEDAEPAVSAITIAAAAAAAAAADADDHNFLCCSFLPLLERIHADFFSAIDGLVECLQEEGDSDASCAIGDSDRVPSASSTGSFSSKTPADLTQLTSPLHKDILPHTVNILRCVLV
jgi:hypothetical protein